MQFPTYEQSNQIPGPQFQKEDFYFVPKFIVLETPISQNHSKI